MVALPVSLAFGVASGLGAAAGLYGAIAVGFFAAVFGGTRSQISGPTAPMAVAMAVIIASHASNLTEALTVVMLGGLLQVLLGVLRIGRFIAYTPHVVVSGFMTGIGIIVMLIQILPFLGAPTASGGPMGAIRALPEAVENLNLSSLVIAVVTLAIGVVWPRRLRRFIPAALVALIVGTLLGVLTLRDAPVIGAVPTGLPQLHLELPSVAFLLRALQPAIILALLGSVDSLLTSLVAGLFGGVPGAGATMGTVTNIRAGGTTRMELDSVVSMPLLDQTFFSDPDAADPYSARVGLVALRGGFTVASAQKLVGVIGPDIREHEVVIFDFSGATYMDDSAAMLIRQLMDVAAEEHTPCIVMGLSGAVADTLNALDILHDFPEGQVVDTLDEARQTARDLLTASAAPTA